MPRPGVVSIAGSSPRCRAAGEAQACMHGCRGNHRLLASYSWHQTSAVTTERLRAAQHGAALLPWKHGTLRNVMNRARPALPCVSLPRHPQRAVIALTLAVIYCRSKVAASVWSCAHGVSESGVSDLVVPSRRLSLPHLPSGPSISVFNSCLLSQDHRENPCRALSPL